MEGSSVSASSSRDGGLWSDFRMKLQQQSLQLEEQERRRAELSDLQQVTTHTCAHMEVHTFMHTKNAQKHMHV